MGVRGRPVNFPTRVGDQVIACGRPIRTESLDWRDPRRELRIQTEISQELSVRVSRGLKRVDLSSRRLLRESERHDADVCSHIQNDRVWRNHVVRCFRYVILKAAKDKQRQIDSL